MLRRQECLLEQLQQVLSLFPEGGALNELCCRCCSALDLLLARPVLPCSMVHKLLQVGLDHDNSLQHDEVGAEACGPCDNGWAVKAWCA